MMFQDLYDALFELLDNKTNRKDLEQCGHAVHYLFENTFQRVKAKEKDVLSRANSLTDYCNDAILMYHFKDVPDYWRRMMMDAGLLVVLIQLGQLVVLEKSDFKSIEPQVQDIMKNLDTCCVISGSPGIERRFISNIILDQLQHYLTQGRGIPHVYKKLQRTKQHVDVTYPITRLEEPPSFEWFLQHCDQDIPTPFIIPKGMIDDWPATSTHPWGSLEYLLSVAGDRVVPVEIGSQYTDSNWSQKMMRFSDFIEKYIQIQDGIPAYLAQHDLFYQVPRLEKDIIVPDYCYIEPRLTPYYSVRAKDVIKNAWFGPKNTISPLHQDPYHNLLVQVHGSKYIRLISPKDSESVYPRPGLMTNTSQVDVEHPDDIQFPLFKQVNYIECILEQGEILYIPPKWWHFVKSLETSFSVSLWF